LFVSTVANATPTRDLFCIALNIYHEARGESYMGQLAVAHVVLNRSHDPRFPSSVCAVVRQAYAFSWVETRFFPKSDKAWDFAITVARVAFEDRDSDPTMGATHYHHVSVHPVWVKQMTRIARIGDHIFYRWENDANNLAY